MPAIASIPGFALRDQAPPSFGSTWDVKADRQHSTSGWLFPHTPTQAPMLSTAPTVMGHTNRYASVADLARVRPRGDHPWPAAAPPPNYRAATPSSAVRLDSVPVIPPSYITTTSHRRTFESYTGVPSFDDAAGRASSQLVRSRILTSSDRASNHRQGHIFTMVRGQGKPQ